MKKKDTDQYMVSPQKAYGVVDRDQREKTIMNKKERERRKRTANLSN
jgi:hypothetical protein